jgi:hypothetical protein
MTTTTSDYLDDFNKTITTIYLLLSPYTQGQRNIRIYIQYIQYKTMLAILLNSFNEKGLA